MFRHELAGGGGWGDPLERDADRVCKDVRDELVSAGSARDNYGVVLTADGRAVDANATAARRDALRTERAWSSPPVVAWDNAGAANALDAAE